MYGSRKGKSRKDQHPVGVGGRGGGGGGFRSGVGVGEVRGSKVWVSW